MGKVRALVVDDDDDIRLLLSMSFLSGPIEIVGEAADGQEAVEMARALKPDVVVMDLMMPIMDGAEATSIIKKELPTTAVFGFSAAESVGVDRLLRAGAVGVFSKDGLADLLKALQNFSSA